MLRSTWGRDSVRRRRRARSVLRFALSFALAGRAGFAGPTLGDEPASLTPSDYRDDAKLADLLWKRSPDVLEARSALGSAASDELRSQLLPNPALDFTWGTV